MRSQDPLLSVPPGAQVNPACPVNWAHPLAQSLVGFWLVSQAPVGWLGNPTSVYDAVRGGANPHDGTINGGLSWVWAGEGLGHCLSGYTGGNPTTTYVDCGNSAALNPTGSFTFAQWVRAASTAAGTLWTLGRDDNSLGRSYVMGVNTTTLQITAQINGAVVLGGGLTTATKEVWHMLAMTGSAANGFVGYIDGVRSNTGSWSAPNTTTGSTTIGKRTFSGFNDGWAGRIGDVLIWNGRQLSDAEMAQLFALGQQGYPGFLDYLWPVEFFGPAVAPAAPVGKIFQVNQSVPTAAYF